MKTLLQEREEARARKDFASADRIRDRITELGLTLEDTPLEQKKLWKFEPGLQMLSKSQSSM